jgi:hypothetical protein
MTHVEQGENQQVEFATADDVAHGDIRHVEDDDSAGADHQFRKRVA